MCLKLGQLSGMSIVDKERPFIYAAVLLLCCCCVIVVCCCCFCWWWWSVLCVSFRLYLDYRIYYK